MIKDTSKSSDLIKAHMSSGAHISDGLTAHGEYTFTFYDNNGNIFYQETVPNLITTVGKNFLWDSTLSASAYTTTGPYMGLISSVSYSAIVAADTMASHAGWTECNSTNAPNYSGATRPTVTYSASSAGVKSTSSTQTFTFSGSGTVNGAFQVTGSAATSSNTGTVGTLFSETLLGTAQPVISGNVLTVSWSGTLT